MSMTPNPSRRATALATLAFASVVTSGTGGAKASAATPSRSATPTPRSTTTRPPSSVAQRTTGTDAPRLSLPDELDVDGVAAELGVHPGRLAAALRKLADNVDELSAAGVDPLTALASELGLPPTDVYLAAARHAARNRGS